MSCAPRGRPDYLLWSSVAFIAFMYGLHLFAAGAVRDSNWLALASAGVFEIVNTVWWGIAMGMVMIALLSKVPREFVLSVLGDGGPAGIFRATLAGVLLDLCSHGILMIGAKLYERGASAGQVMAFLIASPWNSFSLTLILFALVGVFWTLTFLFLSLLVAIVTGLIFERLVRNGVLPANSHQVDLPAHFEFWPEARRRLKGVTYDRALFVSLAKAGFSESRMVIRWLFFGVVLAAVVRASLDTSTFQTFFGPTVAGLGLTLIAATVIEVCSEGSTPIGADLLNRANAPGNGFAFLMTGVSTDYTEVMVLKEATASWKLALFLPLVTVPQIVVLAWLMNSLGG